MRKKQLLFFVVSIVLLSSLSILFKSKLLTKQNLFNSSQNTNTKHQIIVTVLPQKQIVEKIAGENFTVNAVVPLGYSAETYDPTTQDLKIVSSAEIYFRIGHIAFETTHLDKLQSINSKMLVVDTSKNNQLLNILAHDHQETNNTKSVINNNEIDPHVWLSPKMVQQQAEIIYQTLVKTYPENEPQFKTNFEQLNIELDNLDKELQTAFSPIKGKTMLVYHPAFGYLARDYGFIQESIEIEGKEPSINDVKTIIDKAKSENIKVIFVQKQFDQSSAQAIAENIDGAVIQIDPLDPDYFTNMKNMAVTISDKIK